MTRPLPFPERPQDAVMNRRVGNLERRSLTRPQIDQQRTGTGGDTIRMGWFLDGVLVLGTSRGMPFVDGDAYTLDIFTVTLDTAGSSDTDIEVRRNGTGLVTCTLGSGVASGTFDIDESFADGDIYTIAVTAAGTGAAGLQTFARFAS